MNTKKIVGGLILVLLVFTLSGCSKEKNEEIKVDKKVVNDYEVELMELFDRKYNQTNSKLVFEKVVENYVRGSVETPRAINLFLAKKVGEKWEISYEGTEDMSCVRLKSFSFPEELIRGCDRDDQVGVANPAAIYCETNGGKLETVLTKGGEDAICVFDDGSQCPEWDFYDGGCEKGGNFGGDEIIE